MPEMTIYELPASQKPGMFWHGRNVDIVGVTGSIPVTPTIQIKYLAKRYEVPGRFIEPFSASRYTKRADLVLATPPRP